ncbi:MAG: hypothetical protein QXR07_02435 [Nitrososphaerota archaeon]
MSATTKSGNIIQVAAGLYPEESLWFVYSMYVTGVTSTEKDTSQFPLGMSQL